jgi:two-component system OmpR family response regulator
MMADFDGFEVVRWLRAAGNRVPVLFLTARDAPEDRVVGLRLGGDDYLTKPFSLEELIARIDALLRRAQWVKDGAVAGKVESQDGRNDSAATLRFADLILDEDTHEVWRGEDLIPLTATEFELLRCLLREPRKVISKPVLLRAVWDYSFGGDPNVVETYISYLRKKLDRGRTPLVHTVRGAGYILREPPPTLTPNR